MIFFWVIQYVYQQSVLSLGHSAVAMVRSSAFTGATLISFALLSSVLFKWKPRLSVYWRVRRYLGVGGFVFIFLHVFFIMAYVVNYNYAILYANSNPFQNPIMLGLFAYSVLFLMTVTSFDKIVSFLGARVWKRIHRLIYPAYAAMIFHFLFTNPEAMASLPGYVLLFSACLVLAGELYWFLKITKERQARLGVLCVGMGIVVLYVFFAYGMYVHNPNFWGVLEIFR